MLIAKNKKEIHLLPEMANRHGLVAGSTGGGKSVTLQKIAEQFSRIGTPVFMADVKGDLGGLSGAGGNNEKVLERVKQLNLTDFAFEGNLVRYWDVFGKTGAAMKMTIENMGVLLISRLLDLSEAQTGSLYQLFAIAKDYNIKLKNLEDIFSMATTVMNDPESFEQKYGRIASVSFGSLQRSILALKENNEDVLFTKGNAFDINRLFTYDEKGNGTINILDATKLINNPDVYAVFLLGLLSELFNRLPEAGDLAKPKIAFIFDEAHFLFRDAPKALLNMIEKTIKLIRSKGVSVIFASQSPSDIPNVILGQLGNRIQHAMKAFTVKDQKNVKAIAETFSTNGLFDIEKAIFELRTGEAVISCLATDGSPTPTERAWIVPPRSRVGVLKEKITMEQI